jgi:hypothetical protein
LIGIWMNTPKTKALRSIDGVVSRRLYHLPLCVTIWHTTEIVNVEAEMSSITAESLSPRETPATTNNKRR